MILKGVICQYITHPFGGFSYFTNTHFQPAVGYSYVAPTGQNVNVKFATSAFVHPNQPQISATSNHRTPQFMFQNTASSTPLPLSTGIETTSQQQFASFQEPQAQPAVFRQNLVRRGPVGPPRPESLFIPSAGIEQIASDKQIQAYNDFLNQLASENAISTTESQTTTGFDIDPESFINIKF